jgi:hypothetical protein
MPAVKVDFLVSGLAEVIKAFGSVQAAATRAMDAQEKRARRGKQLSEEERKQAWLTSKTYLQIQKNSFAYADRLEKQKVAIALNTSKKTAAIAMADVSVAKDAADKRVKIAKDEGAARVAAAKKAADKIASDEKAATERRLRQEESHRKQHLQIVKNSSAKAAALDEDRLAGRERFGNAVGSRVAMGARRAVGVMAGVAGTALAVGGGFSAVDAVRTRLQDERKAALIANTAFVPGTRERPANADILSRATEVSRAMGMDRSDVLAGLHRYQELTGDFEGGMGNLAMFAKMAKATGTDLSDMMETAGSIRAQNKSITPQKLNEMLLGMIGTGKEHSIEFREMAKVAGKGLATSAAYAGDQGENQRALAGLMQLARPTSGSPEEAATTVARLSSDTFRHMAKTKGLNIFDQEGRIISPQNTVAEVIKATGGNLGKITKLGFNERSGRLFQALAPQYFDAEREKKGSGVDKIREVMDKAISGGYSQENLEADFANVMAQDVEKLEKAFRELQLRLGEVLSQHMPALIDALQKLVPLIVNMTDKIAKFVEWFAGNPLAGIGAVMAASITAELASAGIGFAVKQAIVGLIVAAGEGSAVAGLARAGISGGIPAGALGKAGVIGAVAVGATALGMAGIDYVANNAASGQRTDVMDSIKSTQEAFAAIQSGDVNRQRAALAFIQKDTEAKKAGPAWYEYETDGAYGARQRDIKFNESVVKALEDAIKKAAGNTVAGGGAPGGNRSGAPQAARSNMNTPG